MSEPASSALAATGVAKLIGLAFGATFAAVVVMIMTRPDDRKEWAVALICTVISSICGGAVIIQALELSAWAATFDGLLALAGIYFAAGLPAWVLVRGWFVFAAQRKEAAITEIVKELRDTLGK